jgi:hypothetical protein
MTQALIRPSATLLPSCGREKARCLVSETNSGHMETGSLQAIDDMAKFICPCKHRQHHQARNRCGIQYLVDHFHSSSAVYVLFGLAGAVICSFSTRCSLQPGVTRHNRPFDEFLRLIRVIGDDKLILWTPFDVSVLKAFFHRCR